MKFNKLKESWKNYLSSFKQRSRLIYLFLIDTGAFSIIFLVFYWFSNYLQTKSQDILQGRTAEEVQKLLSTSADPQQVLPFLVNIRSFLLISLVLLVLIIVGALFLFSYSRAMIWNRLQHKKVTKFWRWNLLNLSLIFPLIVFGIVYLIVKLISTIFINLPFKLAPLFTTQYPQFVDNLTSIFNNAVGFYAVLLMSLIIFLIYYSFAQSYKVWDSIGNGFSLFKKNLKPLLVLGLFAALTGLILTVITIPLRKMFLYSPVISAISSLIIASLYFAWLRIYLLKTIHHEH